MTSAKIIDYEIILLLTKYGRNKVIDALAKQLNTSREDLDARLREMTTAKPTPRSQPTKRRSQADPLPAVIAKYPDKAEPLRILHDRFLNRTFLPELRDVRRFFDRRGWDFGRIQTRAKSLSSLLDLLAELEIAELKELCATPHPADYSALAVIADEILHVNK